MVMLLLLLFLDFFGSLICTVCIYFDWRLYRTHINLLLYRKRPIFLRIYKNFKNFSCGGLLHNILCKVFKSWTRRIYKKITNNNKRKRLYCLRDWCFEINTTSYFASTIAFDTWLICQNLSGRFSINGFCLLGKAIGKAEYNFIEFYTS